MTIREFVDKHSSLETERLKLRMRKNAQNLDEAVADLLNFYSQKKF